MNNSVLASLVVAFLQACKVPLGMWKTDPAFAVKGLSPVEDFQLPLQEQ
jgi:hypothetical protein